MASARVLIVDTVMDDDQAMVSLASLVNGFFNQPTPTLAQQEARVAAIKAAPTTTVELVAAPLKRLRPSRIKKGAGRRR
jgi:hypothetical protein